MKTALREHFGQRLAQIAIAAVLLASWEAAGRLSSKAAFSLGTPSAVLRELMQMIVNEGFHRHFLVTGFEAIAGLLIGTTVGMALGLSLWFSAWAARVSRPFVIALGSLPIIAFAPLMIIWFGVDVQMKVALAALSTLFIAFNQAHHGVSKVAERYIEVMRGLNAARTQTFVKVVVPASMDWVLNSMRLNVGFGLLGAFIGEFISSDRGLGYLILRASALYNVPRALAAAAGIVVLALLLDRTANWIEKHRYLIAQWISVPQLLWRH